MWIQLIIIVNLAVFGYLGFGLVAVGYVVQASLVYCSGWLVYKLCSEFWDELAYRYEREKVMREWAGNRRKLL